MKNSTADFLEQQSVLLIKAGNAIQVLTGLLEDNEARKSGLIEGEALPPLVTGGVLNALDVLALSIQEAGNKMFTRSVEQINEGGAR